MHVLSQAPVQVTSQVPLHVALQPILHDVVQSFEQVRLQKFPQPEQPDEVELLAQLSPHPELHELLQPVLPPSSPPSFPEVAVDEPSHPDVQVFIQLLLHDVPQPLAAEPTQLPLHDVPQPDWAEPTQLLLHDAPQPDCAEPTQLLLHPNCGSSPQPIRVGPNTTAPIIGNVRIKLFLKNSLRFMLRKALINLVAMILSRY
ncbi:MAG TPA: hypothetical protein IAA88_03395 [Candidatus Avimuribaculum pullicola]|nr:hypothetical protein [Candidatus Avimuribaculum pullicola]